MVQDAEGNNVPVHMGSHGIGITPDRRIDRGEPRREWHYLARRVTPFHCGIVNLKQGDDEADAACDSLYKSLIALGLDPLYDDAKSGQGANL